MSDAPKTSISGAAPYAAPADFLQFYDARLVGQLVRDDGKLSTPTQLASDPVLAEVLAAASGLVEVEAMAGARYTAMDLQALTGNGLALLKALVSAVALSRLVARRGLMELANHPDIAWAGSLLDRLRAGQMIFPFQEAAQAGLADIHAMSMQEIRDLDLLTDRADRFFGIRPMRRFFGT